MIGSIIGNYKIVSKIGEGGMGSVFLAEHTKLSRKVAIKNLHDVLIKNEEIRKRFQNEAEAMAKLQHENIVNLLDFEENENGLFLIMEYVDGAPLDELLKANSIPADQSLGIIKSVLEGLNYAHKKNIVHRDIKPSNILINSEDMSPKILDFGIAKMLGTDNSMTKTGTQMGTVYFMSPEQVKGEKVDQRSDIYSVGVTLFQLINGSNPYANLNTEYEVYNKIVSEELPDLTSKGVAQGVVDIISKATAKNINERFQTCQEMIDAISDFLSGRKSKISTKPKTNSNYSSTNEKGGNQVLWIVLVVVLIGGIGVTAFFLNENGKFREWFGNEKNEATTTPSDGYPSDLNEERSPESNPKPGSTELYEQGTPSDGPVADESAAADDEYYVLDNQSSRRMREAIEKFFEYGNGYSYEKDLYGLLSCYSFPITYNSKYRQYYDDLEKVYSVSWNKKNYSKNTIINFKAISDYECEVLLKYVWQTNDGINGSVESLHRYGFDYDYKIKLDVRLERQYN